MRTTFEYTIRAFNILIVGLLVLLLTACSFNGNGTDTQATPTTAAVRVNGFGTAANHVHSLVVLPNHVLVLATHYGIFRSGDGGATWQQTAAGPNQPIQGLMAYSLTYSPLDSKRLYVLTQIAVSPHNGILGIYTSADQGQTWQMTVTTASLTSSSIFTEAAGNDTPNELYIYLRELGALGLRVSLDNGKHFSSTGTLPFGSILGVLPLPGAPGQLLAYGDDGMARSADGGAHWQVLKGISGGIQDVATAEPHSPIYASGDAGIYSSQDGGKTFSLVYSQASYNSLTVSPAQTQVIYGKAGLATYRSADGGHTWHALPHISGNLAQLAVDPTNASAVYLALSYPTAVYQLGQNGAQWQSRTPQG